MLYTRYIPITCMHSITNKCSYNSNINNHSMSSYVLFIVAELEHVELGTDVSAQGSDMGRVVHAKRRWHQRSTK